MPMVPNAMRRLFVLAATCAALGNARAADAVPRIPLDVGLFVVSATHDVSGDYEVFLTVGAADEKDVTYELRRTDLEMTGGDPASRAFSVPRIVERQDLAEANRIVAYFHVQDPARFPGSTVGQASATLFATLKRGEPAPFVFGTASGAFGMFGARKYFRGALQRVEAETVPKSVLVNGEPVALPTIHVKGTLSVGGDSGEAEFWFLDQDDHPMTLLWTFKESQVQVIRIDTPAATAETESDALGAALESAACRAALHGVYFDSGSAVLVPQSMTEISAVAALMNAHPDWHLTIEGHTDDIGSDADNLGLSQARAEAVRTVLLNVNGIAAERLTASGFGETRPIDTNETLEGRARNRRVEIARECS